MGGRVAGWRGGVHITITHQPYVPPRTRAPNSQPQGTSVSYHIDMWATAVIYQVFEDT